MAIGDAGRFDSAAMMSFHQRRRRMVQEQLVARGITDTRTLRAMGLVPRERFLSAALVRSAYEDAPLPIEEGQTISQPFVVALMISALQLGPEDRVLEVGAGSGYAAAVLSRIVREVFAVERYRSLADLARRRNERLGYENVKILCGDGTHGWPEHAPYDAILVSAGGPEPPSSLLEQLAVGGRLIMPVGTEPGSQELLLVRRTGKGRLDSRRLGRVRFVPLIVMNGDDDAGPDAE